MKALMLSALLIASTALAETIWINEDTNDVVSNGTFECATRAGKTVPHEGRMDRTYDLGQAKAECMINHGWHIHNYKPSSNFDGH